MFSSRGYAFSDRSAEGVVESFILANFSVINGTLATHLLIMHLCLLGTAGISIIMLSLAASNRHNDNDQKT
jgi:hypothetical protein